MAQVEAEERGALYLEFKIGRSYKKPLDVYTGYPMRGGAKQQRLSYYEDAMVWYDTKDYDTTHTLHTINHEYERRSILCLSLIRF